MQAAVMQILETQVEVELVQVMMAKMQALQVAEVVPALAPPACGTNRKWQVYNGLTRIERRICSHAALSRYNVLNALIIDALPCKQKPADCVSET